MGLFFEISNLATRAGSEKGGGGMEIYPFSILKTNDNHALQVSGLKRRIISMQYTLRIVCNAGMYICTKAKQISKALI